MLLCIYCFSHPFEIHTQRICLAATVTVGLGVYVRNPLRIRCGVHTASNYKHHLVCKLLYVLLISRWGKLWTLLCAQHRDGEEVKRDALLQLTSAWLGNNILCYCCVNTTSFPLTNLPAKILPKTHQGSDSR